MGTPTLRLLNCELSSVGRIAAVSAADAKHDVYRNRDDSDAESRQNVEVAVIGERTWGNALL
jgi:hypothetical protein